MEVNDFFDLEHIPNYPLLNLKKHRQVREEEYSKLPEDERRIREEWDEAHKPLPLDAYKPTHMIPTKGFAHIKYWPHFFLTGATFGTIISVFVYGIPSIYRTRKAKETQSYSLQSLAIDRNLRAFLKARRMIFNFGCFQMVFEVVGGLAKDWNAPRFWSAMLGGTIAGGVLSMKAPSRFQSFYRGAIIGAILIGIIEMALGASMVRAIPMKPFELDMKYRPSVNPLRLPPTPYPEPDEESIETRKVWLHNSKLNSTKEEYQHDNRIWAWPDLNIVGQKISGNIFGAPGSEDAAFESINSSRAYKIGQSDWRSENQSTGRFTNKFIAADKFGTKGLVLDDLEIFVQNQFDNDLTFNDSSLVELADSLAQAGEKLEISASKGENIKLERDNIIIPARYRTTIQDTWKECVDYLIVKKQGLNISNQFLQHIKRLLEHEQLPLDKQPLYFIDDGPGDLDSTLKEFEDFRYNNVITHPNDYRGDSKRSEGKTYSGSTLHHIFWETLDGKTIPPGLPLGLPNRYYLGLHHGL